MDNLTNTQMEHYIYKGPVMEFNHCVALQWKGETFAPSEQKARSNLTYQFKRSVGKSKSSKITLPGKLTTL